MRSAQQSMVLLLSLAAISCGSEESPAPATPARAEVIVVTFNTGSNPDLGHDALPDDGYSEADAQFTDEYYGNGLAWKEVIDDTRAFFATTDVDIVVFQEIFFSGDCTGIPAKAAEGFVCEDYSPGDRTVAQLILGDAFQVACHQGKPDKCAAVRRSFGTFRGCDADLCLDHLDGAPVVDCGSGSRIGRGVIDRSDGSTLTVVNVHGSSGIKPEDRACRRQQFEQVFDDLDGEPAANGVVNIIMGDLNTDPGRTADDDESAAFWNERVGPGRTFESVTPVGTDAQPTYLGLFNIDHVVSDAFDGDCWFAGISEGHPAVSDVLFFDHRPIVCGLDRKP